MTDRLSLNLDKTKFMIFKPRQKLLELDMKLLLNDREIDQVKKIVFLGVILDDKLSWKSHISHVSTKISKSIGIIRKSSFFSFETIIVYFILLNGVPKPAILQYCLGIYVCIQPVSSGSSSETYCENYE